MNPPLHWLIAAPVVLILVISFAIYLATGTSASMRNTLNEVSDTPVNRSYPRILLLVTQYISLPLLVLSFFWYLAVRLDQVSDPVGAIFAMLFGVTVGILIFREYHHRERQRWLSDHASDARYKLYDPLVKLPEHDQHVWIILDASRRHGQVRPAQWNEVTQTFVSGFGWVEFRDVHRWADLQIPQIKPDEGV